VQILEIALEVYLVVLPYQAVHPRCRIPLEGMKRHAEQIDADMVEERSEPLLLICLRDLSYAVQRL
jgi:hypothetical protein